MKVILVNLHDGTKDDLKDHKPIKVFEVSDKATLNGYETIDWIAFSYTHLWDEGDLS
jgi:hypothetical protein